MADERDGENGNGGDGENGNTQSNGATEEHALRSGSFVAGFHREPLHVENLWTFGEFPVHLATPKIFFRWFALENERPPRRARSFVRRFA